MADTEQVHRGSGDFLADAGIADPAEFRLKAHLANEISVAIERRGFAPAEAARAVGFTEFGVTEIVAGRVDVLSVWVLMKALAALGADITVVIHPAGDEPGTILAQSLEG